MSCCILVGDALDALKTLPADSVQCIVTSPPYWGLRDYGVAGQLGLERTPEEYVAGMVAVFREVRRVLRDDGTLWLNLGDSYAGSGRGAWNVDDAVKDAAGVKEVYRPKTDAIRDLHDNAVDAGAIGRKWTPDPEGLKQKDLIGIPWRVAFALQADGWWLRSDIIWAKPNPMPESVTDRPTKSHEYLFLLTKSARYYYDAKAIAEPVAGATIERLAQPNLSEQEGSPVPFKTNGMMKAVPSRWPVIGPTHAAARGRNEHQEPMEMHPTRNARSVWTIPTSPYPEAHFATFPAELPRRCILAGSRPADIVLDPFMGAGTTGLVARRLGRSCIGIELNPEYATLAKNRIQDDCPLFETVELQDVGRAV